MLRSPAQHNLMAGDALLLHSENPRFFSVVNLCLGGIAIFVFAFDMLVGLPQTGGDPQALWLLSLIVLISLPHFFLSYFRFYGFFSGLLFKKFEFFLHGVLVPLMLAIAGLACVWSPPLRGYYVMIMILTVGWHYSRQTYGYILVILRERGIGNLGWFAPTLNIQGISLWLLALAISRAPGQGPMRPYGFTLPLGNISWLVLILAMALAVVSTGLLFHYLYKVHQQTGFDSAFTKIILVFLANVVLQLYPVLNPSFWEYVPFLHSLQYLPIYSQTENNGLRWGKYAIAAILGVLFIRQIPMYLDRPEMGKVWLMVAATFVNVHHFAIESVIWRSSNLRLMRQPGR